MARGRQREEAIRGAMIQLLQEQGYQAVTMDGVASRAHASKATIYRRWRNKAELVKAALDALDRQHSEAIPDTGELRSDLVAVLKAMRQKATAPYMAMINDLIGASRHDKELAALLQSHVRNDELSPFEPVLRRANKRDGIPSDRCATLVHDVAEAMILRQLQTGSPFDSKFISRVVDGVLLPLLQVRKRKR
jgi:AcrR family transcriptional regulator